MKIILVDAVDCFVIEGEGIFEEMYEMLEEFNNKKIIVTNANEEEKVELGIIDMPYEVFSLAHNPNKTNPEYFKKLLKHFSLSTKDVIYFEHNPEAVNSAKSIGINTFHYNNDSRDLEGLRQFLVDSL